MLDQDLSLDGRVAVVTGSGSGLGASEAVELARSGAAAVVINDIRSSEATDSVIADIEAAGAKAELVVGDVSERETADAMMAAALKLGGLHVVVNNAGITRDKMLFNGSDEDFDAVVKVHLRGHFLLTRNAAAHWRAEDKKRTEGSAPIYGRLINTSSEAGQSPTTTPMKRSGSSRGRGRPRRRSSGRSSSISRTPPCTGRWARRSPTWRSTGAGTRRGGMCCCVSATPGRSTWASSRRRRRCPRRNRSRGPGSSIATVVARIRALPKSKITLVSIAGAPLPGHSVRRSGCRQGR